MSEIPSSSFIPKRKSIDNVRQVRHRNIYILSIIIYALFIAAPLASATVFIYQKYTENVFQQNVINLDSAIKDFKEADMLRVVEFNERLKFSNQLLNSHVSLVSLLNLLEGATTKTVQFNSLKITQSDQVSLLVEAELGTDSFDNVLFQRGQYKNNQSITSTNFSNLIFTPITIDMDNTTKGQDKRLIQLSAQFIFDKDVILYTPNIINLPSTQQDTNSTTTPEETSNQVSS